MKICSECKKAFRILKYKNINGKQVCYLCNKEKCYNCGEYSSVKSRKNGEAVCKKCYKPPKRICVICNKKEIINNNTELGPVCKKCYKSPKGVCNKCGEYSPVESRRNGEVVCKKCYRTAIETCILCGKEGNFITRDKNKNAICQSCYKTPIEKCTSCGKYKNIWRRTNSDVLCHSCYVLNRLETDEEFYIKEQLRKRIRSAFDNFSTTGKHTSAKKYNISYDKIVEHLGPCPGNRKDYHIDHILPLAAFNFDNKIHIQAAFAPENHQWLTKKENLSKNAIYDVEEFLQYISVWEDKLGGTK